MYEDLKFELDHGTGHTVPTTISYVHTCTSTLN